MGRIAHGILLVAVLTAGCAGTAFGELWADPTSLDYGVRRWSGQYDQDVTITAVGHESSISCGFTGPDGPEFSLQTACPTTLTDTSIALTVRFAPTSVGAKSATLLVSGSLHGDLHVPLNATVPVLWVSPTAYSFGNTLVGTDDGPVAFSVTNDHDGTVVVTDISEGGPGCAEFSNSPVADATLAMGQSTTFTITHHPTTTGFASCEYTVWNNSAQGIPTTISVSGTGVAPEITLNPPSPFDFGTLSSPNPTAQAFTVGNTGTADLDVTAITKGWTAGCGHFLLSDVGNVTSFPIAQGSSEAFTVIFAPLDSGPFSCDITIESNDPDHSSLVLTVQGECQGDCWTIFADGFESGNTTAWSSTFPPPQELSVYDLQDTTSQNHPSEGTLVTVRGAVCTAIDGWNSGVGNFWIQEPAGGMYSGIMVYNPGSVDVSGLSIGDVVDVSGTYEEYYDESEIVVGSLTVVSPGTAPVPDVVLPADVATGGPSAEAYEGVLVEVESVVVTAGPNIYGEFQVTGGLLIDDDLYEITPAPGLGDGFSSLTGVMRYTFSDAKLEPRSAADVVPP